MRAFYAHGLVTGMVFVGLGQISFGLTGMPLFGIGVPSDKGPGCHSLLMVPSFAGYLVGWAAGDRRSGRAEPGRGDPDIPAYGSSG